MQTSCQNKENYRQFYEKGTFAATADQVMDLLFSLGYSVCSAVYGEQYTFNIEFVNDKEHLSNFVTATALTKLDKASNFYGIKIQDERFIAKFSGYHIKYYI